MHIHVSKESNKRNGKDEVKVKRKHKKHEKRETEITNQPISLQEDDNYEYLKQLENKK